MVVAHLKTALTVLLDSIVAKKAWMILLAHVQNGIYAKEAHQVLLQKTPQLAINALWDFTVN